MQLLYDFLPIVLFFIVYKLSNIYMATAAAMIMTLLQVSIYRIRHHKFDQLQFITLVLIMVLGGATLILHKPIFIKWKPSAIYWVFALIFLGSHFIGKKTVIQYLMGSKIELPSIAWSRLNFSWAIFFLLMGFLNIYVVYHYSTNTWVNFKLFGILGLTVVFMLLQAFYLAKYLKEDQDDN